ncbi:hypothetical protein FPY71_12360 [Aureimonas fodinaquatilis]|uniref:Uncharacterized protein n=1 Tax=Aureimonas fodinaquatilis TaxID=2565783 RepID=A0A5B0DSI0_9HYPH|nr:hypothetical protein [Aureimonas fodinaquatilis]KAA0969343.1 hypothetical protein FPY71_12360 [Aureimonas fodinaquatilis]
MSYMDEDIDYLADMLMQSRQIALDASMEQVLPALDAALFITGREIARRLAEKDIMDVGGTVN